MRVLLENLKSFRSVTRHDGLVAVALQRVHSRAPYDLLVIKTRTLPWPVKSRTGRRASFSCTCSATAGTHTLNVVPCPGLLYTLSAPPCPVTIPSTADNPKPRPVNFVVKNGSKILAIVSSSMPHP